MNFNKLLFELTSDAKWNLDYIFNDLQTRIKKQPGAPNFGLHGIVDMVRQEYFLYKSKGQKKYGITVWCLSNVDNEKIMETANFLKKIYKNIFAKYGFKIQVNNKLIKILLSETAE